MKILAIDTTNIRPSVCLFDGAKILSLKIIEQASKPAELLIPCIEEVLSENNIWYQDLAAVGVCKGPASFTSVRIGLSCVKTLSLAVKIPFYSFDSLLAIANKYRDFDTKILVAMDAKMNEFFVGEFLAKNGVISVISESKLMSLSELENLDLSGDFMICGSGKSVVEKVCGRARLSDGRDEISADSLALMTHEACFDDEKIEDEELKALYLRDPKISERKK